MKLASWEAPAKSCSTVICTRKFSPILINIPSTQFPFIVRSKHSIVVDIISIIQLFEFFFLVSLLRENNFSCFFLFSTAKKFEAFLLVFCSLSPSCSCYWCIFNVHWDIFSNKLWLLANLSSILERVHGKPEVMSLVTISSTFLIIYYHLKENFRNIFTSFHVTLWFSTFSSFSPEIFHSRKFSFWFVIKFCCYLTRITVIKLLTIQMFLKFSTILFWLKIKLKEKHLLKAQHKHLFLNKYEGKWRKISENTKLAGDKSFAE